MQIVISRGFSILFSFRDVFGNFLLTAANGNHYFVAEVAVTVQSIRLVTDIFSGVTRGRGAHRPG